MVQTVQGVNTSLHEEVFVQVVFHTETGHSHSGTVIRVGTDLFQFLVSEATGNVRTQRTFSEVVNGFNVGELAVDIFTGVRTVIHFQTLVSTQADVQQYVVGDKVAQATTNQSTVVQIVAAVGEIALGEGFDFNRTGTLGHDRQRGAGDSSTYNDTYCVFQFHL